MKKNRQFTIADKDILLMAIDHYIDAVNRFTSSMPKERIENSDNFSEIHEARVNFILEMYDLEIYKEDLGNIYIIDSWYSYCYLCKKPTDITFPESPKINGNYICKSCCEKYFDSEFKNICENNKKFWDDENRFWEEQEDSHEQKGAMMKKIENDEDLPF
jgi:hypothetical protein